MPRMSEKVLYGAAWESRKRRLARESEAAFHARLNAARHELETNPNPYERHKAAAVIGQMTCNRPAVPEFPDDRLWLGNWQERKYPELDAYTKRCRRLWSEAHRA